MTRAATVRAAGATVVAVALLAATASAAQEQRPRLVVLDLVSERGIDDGTARLLNELLLSEFTASGLYEVVGGSDVQAILSNEAQKQLAGCTDAACLAEVGGALGGDFLAVASIGKIGDYYLVNVKVLSVHTAEVVARHSRQVEGAENRLMSAVRESVVAVAKSAAKQAGPTVVAESDVAAGADFGLWPWAAGGVAVVGAGVGVTFGVLALSELKYSRWDQRYAAATAAAESSAMVANIGFVVGGVAAATSAGLFVGALLFSDQTAVTATVVTRPTQASAVVATVR